MQKNKGKGGKNRRRGKNENEAKKRELVLKEDDQENAQVVKMLGNGSLEAMCFDGVKKLCHIWGKLRKKVQPRIDDILDKLSQAKYFSSFDLTQGYWHVPIYPADSSSLRIFTA